MRYTVEYQQYVCRQFFVLTKLQKKYGEHFFSSFNFQVGIVKHGPFTLSHSITSSFNETKNLIAISNDN